jgi:two-component system chemotaxis response regulator CheB
MTSMDGEIRILVVEDSPTVRHYLTMLINDTPDMHVIGYADNGEDAVRMVDDLRPHVVSMDINLPRLDGLGAIRRIMVRCPTPVVVVSGLLEDDIALSLRALEAGALAVVGKPPHPEHVNFVNAQRQLINTLRAMARVTVVARRQRLQDQAADEAGNQQASLWAEDVTEHRRPRNLGRHPKPEVVGIAASTGGPSALQRIFAQLSDALTVPIIVVQHMPAEFISGLVHWLNQSSPLPVIVAHDGMILRGGYVVFAPGDVHLVVQRRGFDLMVRLVRARGGHRHQPSADVLFDSMAKTCGASAIGIMLTGMGDDGALGLAELRQAGAYTLAQDETTSTVFGMPSAAIERGAVERILPLEKIPSEIIKLV